MAVTKAILGDLVFGSTPLGSQAGGQVFDEYASGGAMLGGASDVYLLKTLFVAGGAKAGGVADLAVTYAPTPTAGAKAGDVADLAVTYAPTPTAGVKAGDVADLTVTYAPTPTAGIKAGDVADLTVTYAPTPTAGVKAGDATDAFRIFSNDGVGGTKAGAATDAFRAYYDNGIGGIKAGDVADFAVTYAPTPTVGAKAGDIADFAITYVPTPTAGVKVGDATDAFKTFYDDGLGGAKAGSSFLLPSTNKPLKAYWDLDNPLRNGCVLYLPFTETGGSNFTRDISPTNTVAWAATGANKHWCHINGDWAMVNDATYFYVLSATALNFTGDYTLVWYGYLPTNVTDSSTGVIGRMSYIPERGPDMQPYQGQFTFAYASDGNTSFSTLVDYPPRNPELFTGVFCAGSYVDGYAHNDRIFHETNNVPNPFYIPATRAWQIMARGDGNTEHGAVLGVAMWNRALSPDEIAALNNDFWALARGFYFCGGTKVGGAADVRSDSLSLQPKPTIPVWDSASNLATDCVCYMPFVSDFTDLSGVVSASIVGSPVWGSSVLGPYLDCNGTQYVTLGDPASMRFTGGHTLAFYGSTRGQDGNYASGTNSGLIAKYGDWFNTGVDFASGFQLYDVFSDIELFADAYDGGANQEWLYDGVPLQQHLPWDLWICVYAANSIKIYQNNTLVADWSIATATFVNTNGKPWNVLTNGTADFICPGYIQGVALWNRSLSPDEVAALNRDFFVLAKGLLFGGSETGGEADVTMTRVFNEEMVGGTRVGDTADVGRVLSESFVNGVKLGEAAECFLVFVRMPQGGAKLDGTVDVAADYSVASLGGLRIYGLVLVEVSEEGGGGGEGPPGIVITEYAEGGVLFGGLAEVNRFRPPHPGPGGGEGEIPYPDWDTFKPEKTAWLIEYMGKLLGVDYRRLIFRYDGPTSNPNDDIFVQHPRDRLYLPEKQTPQPKSRELLKYEQYAKHSPALNKYAAENNIIYFL